MIIHAGMALRYKSGLNLAVLATPDGTTSHIATLNQGDVVVALSGINRYVRSDGTGGWWVVKVLLPTGEIGYALYFSHGFEELK